MKLAALREHVKPPGGPHSSAVLLLPWRRCRFVTMLGPDSEQPNIRKPLGSGAGCRRGRCPSRVLSVVPAPSWAGRIRLAAADDHLQRRAGAAKQVAEVVGRADAAADHAGAEQHVALSGR